jgi:hypothetical protein
LIALEDIFSITKSGFVNIKEGYSDLICLFSIFILTKNESE